MFDSVVAASVTVKPTSSPEQSVNSISTEKSPPVSRLTDKERRSRYLHTENLSTPSISGILSGNNLSGVSEPSIKGLKGKGNNLEEPFDLVRLVNVWKEFAVSVEAAQLKSALTVREPFLIDDFSVGYNLDNEVQMQRITQDLKSKLLAHLHHSLKNEKISLEFNVTENKAEILNKPYTNQEKFNVLASKYPILGLMKQQFGLDFE